MPGSRQTLEQHMAGLRLQELTGDDILVPFPALCSHLLHMRGIEDGQCLVTAVMERTAVICPRDTPHDLLHSDRALKTQVRLQDVTIDPADVRTIDPHHKRGTVNDRGAKARGRQAARAGKGVRARQAAQRAESHQDATEAVG